ncbi:hypothetical protein EVAR_62668_1 [Eumeta japonica]|uniref:RNA-directed DNA polymerase from mobile element jockey n=1 Tax=Eumeta variegata TaxID=151549 RepID=A0A4C1Z3F5_EUMVA|nr:hypothetical protein EVAR_62668_1 [Eumeta japonica]
MSQLTGFPAPPSVRRLKPKNIMSLSFNARGIMNNMAELSVCAKEYSLDVILVQESFLKPHMRRACKLRNYVQVRTNRQGISGEDKDRDRPDILDIALMKNVALKLSRIVMLQRLTSDHCPILMRLRPMSDDRPSDVKKITNWKKVSIALEKIDTPTLNRIPNDIVSTNDINNAIGALISHITTVGGDNLRKVPGIPIAGFYPLTLGN